MIVIGQGTYHNGKTASAFEKEISVDIENGRIFFKHEEETIEWQVNGYHFEKRGSTLILFHEKDYSNFEITDPDFAIPFLQRFDSRLKASFYQKVLRAGFAAHIGLAVLTLGIIIFLSQYGVPKLAEKSVYLIPSSFENHLGKTYYDEFMSYPYVEKNERKSEIIQEFVNKLDLDTKKKIKITVVEDWQVNAFALPSGHVVIFTGILDKMERYEELAALISHEVSHVNKRHSMRALLREYSGTLFLSAIVGDISKFTDILISNANKLTGLSYSRELETEADKEGLRLMKLNKVNTIGFRLLFESLSEEGGDMEGVEFLSTHPVTKDRISMANKNKYKGVQDKELVELFKSLMEPQEEDEEPEILDEAFEELQEMIENQQQE